MNQSMKVACITGATSGIGLAVVKTLHREGYQLVAHGRNRDKLEMLKNKTGCRTVVGDITEPGIPEKILHTTLEEYGQCDVFLNNAGMIEVGAIEEIDIDKVCQMMRVNVEAAIRIVYLVIKYFKAEDRGHLINISSIMGTKVRPTAGAYAASKYAIEALSEALRMELSKTNVRVTCIQPGLVKTELHKEWKKHPAEMFDIPNPLTPEDIAKTILWILSQPDHIRIPTLMMLPKDHII